MHLYKHTASPANLKDFFHHPQLLPFILSEKELFAAVG